MHEVVRAGKGRRIDLDERCPEGSNRILFFLGLGTGHNNDDFVAKGAADERQADSRIAGCALNDRSPRAQAAIGFRLSDDVEGGPVLD